MIPVHIVDPKTKLGIHLEQPYNGFEPVEGNSLIPVVISPPQVHGTFKSATRTTTGTTMITDPSPGGSIILTDLLISGEKQAGSSTEVRFTDGSNTITIFLASAVDAPPNFAHTFAGRFQGWRDARIDMVTVGSGDATITVGYMKIASSLIFEEWDGLR